MSNCVDSQIYAWRLFPVLELQARMGVLCLPEHSDACKCKLVFIENEFR
jgi:hypothetical protein